jgi:hypothetical protein
MQIHPTPLPTSLHTPYPLITKCCPAVAAACLLLFLLPPAAVTAHCWQVSGLINRPEIPRLAGANKSLLVKAYDLGLIDALGCTEGRAVRELLAAAQSQVGGFRVL